MNREIKFRVWDGNRISYAASLSGIVLCDNGGHSYLPFYTEKSIPHFTGVEIQQFTGLKDKNGREIYEGDIIKQFHSYIDIEAREWIGVVKYSITQQGQLYYPTYSLFVNEYISFNLRLDSEVIGNIFENPELIKENI